MRLMMAADWGWTGACETSVFHGLSDGNTWQPPTVGPGGRTRSAVSATRAGRSIVVITAETTPPIITTMTATTAAARRIGGRATAQPPIWPLVRAGRVNVTWLIW